MTSTIGMSSLSPVVVLTKNVIAIFMYENDACRVRNACNNPNMII